jgi:recombination protein RecT
MAEIAKAVPEHVRPDRMARAFMTILAKTPKLAECTPESFFLAVMTCSQLGLEPDGRVAYLIPFENRSKNIVECQLVIGYRGLAELVMRSGTISYLHADVVRENDDFDWDMGRITKHRVNFRKPRGSAFAAYAIAHTKDGGMFCEVMSEPEILDIRNGSQGWQAFVKGYTKQSPWDPTNEGSEKEMWKKTAFRRLCKWLPLSPEIRTVIEANDEDPQARPRAIVSEFTPTFELDGAATPAIEVGVIQ